MKLARDLERRLERLMDGVAARLFPGRVGSEELATRILREMDLGVLEGTAGPTAPNVFGVRMHSDDLGAAEAPDELTAELSGIIEELAADRGWRLEGVPVVSVVTDPSMPRGGIDVSASFGSTERPAWARLRPKDGGQDIFLTHNRVLIGRADECDVQIPIMEVSREHAQIWRESTGVWIADLGSSNGTTVNGVSAAQPVGLGAGDAIVFGPAAFTFLAASG